MDPIPPEPCQQSWDDRARAQFKWKFYRLVVELNAIILLGAVSVVIYFLIHSAYTIPCMAVMLACAAVLILDFRNKYRETKAWLNEHESKKGVTGNGR